MRILYVVEGWRLGHAYLLGEILQLEDCGIDVLVDTLLPVNSHRHPDLATLKADVRTLSDRPSLRSRLVAEAHLRLASRHPLRWLRGAATAARERRWTEFLTAGIVADRARRADVDHIHAHFATAALDHAVEAACLVGVTVTVTCHSEDIFNRDRVQRFKQRLGKLDAVMATSRYDKRHLEQLAPGLPVYHVPNGTTVAKTTEPLRGNALLLCVADLVEKQGVDVLIAAVAMLAKGEPDLRIDVMGTGPLDRALKELADLLGVADRFTWRGLVTSEEVEAAMQRSRALVLPCRVARDGNRNGIPAALTEAMARGVPVISTRVGGIPELVRHGETGICVPPENPTELARAIRDLLRDDALVTRLSEAGRNEVRLLFNPARSANRLIHAWVEIQASAGSRRQTHGSRSGAIRPTWRDPATTPSPPVR